MRKVFIAALLLALAAAAPSSAGAAWPERPVKVIVPFPPGGGVDVVARMVSERLTQSMGQSFVVDNRAGAAGIIGCELVAKAPPDGYTVLVTSNSTHGTNSAVHKTLPYDPVADYVPIAMMTRVTYMLLGSNKLPVSDAAQLFAWARNPPQKLTYGSYGLGSVVHLPMELLASRASLELIHVPYKGAAPANQALVQGEIELLFDSSIGSGAAIRAGSIKLLGVAGPARVPAFPDAKTLAEQGLPGFQAGAFFGLWAPARTPAAITDALYKQVAAALAEPALREKLVATGYEVVGAPGPELGAAVAEAVATNKRVVEERKLTFE
jgi:tripartite-type tricarboxylate transporter receptor subunit TctC